MKNWVDIVFALAALISFFRGWRAGFISTLLTFIGYIGGGLLGLVFGLHHFHFHGVSRFLFLFLMVALGSSLGEVIFKSIGKLFHNKILFAPLTWIDSILGACFSVLRTLIMLVILGHLLLITPWSWVHDIPQSTIYSKLNAQAPSIISEITKRAETQIH
jgi:uncharacterized membrane protein required for colicin V production